MSGAYIKKSKRGYGNILLYTLAYYLKEFGFKYWDMGMKIKYKIEMGGKMIPRKEFINLV